MTVLQVDEPRAVALCRDASGARVTVEILLVAPVAPGDEVLVHGMPSRIERGERRSFASHATVHQASWPRRQWTRLTGRFAFYELYDVGFEG
jgi:hypothetical protein